MTYDKRWLGKAKKYQRAMERINTTSPSDFSERLVRWATIYYKAGGWHSTTKENLKKYVSYGEVDRIERDSWRCDEHTFNHVEMVRAHREAMRFLHARHSMTQGTQAHGL